MSSKNCFKMRSMAPKFILDPPKCAQDPNETFWLQGCQAIRSLFPALEALKIQEFCEKCKKSATRPRTAGSAAQEVVHPQSTRWSVLGGGQVALDFDG